jgi:hypothetical protein
VAELGVRDHVAALALQQPFRNKVNSDPAQLNRTISPPTLRCPAGEWLAEGLYPQRRLSQWGSKFC